LTEPPEVRLVPLSAALICASAFATSSKAGRIEAGVWLANCLSTAMRPCRLFVPTPESACENAVSRLES